MSEEQSNPEELKEELKKIRNDYNRAKKLLEDIEEFGSNFEKLRNLLDNKDDGVKKNFELIKEKKTEIDLLKEQSQNFLNEISTNLEKVKENIESMNNAYNEFSEIKGKIEGSSGEIKILLSNARSLKNDIEDAKSEAQSTLGNIKSAFVEVQEKTGNMQDAYEKFLEIKGKIEDNDSGLEIIFNSVQSIKKKSKIIFSEIQLFRDESNKLLEDIKENKNQSDNLKDKIFNNFDFTKIKKTEIENATGLIIDASFAETFERRRKKIEERIDKKFSWKNIFLISTLLLVVVVLASFTEIVPYLDLGNSNGLDLFLKRIVLTFPLLLLITFSSVQYSKERDLEEKYAFKASSSSAIRSHIEYLLSKFGEDDEKVQEFAIKTFTTIYKEPYHIKDEQKNKLKDLEKKIKNLAESKNEVVNIEDIISSTKELKGLFSNEALLEKVIGLFSKRR